MTRLSPLLIWIASAGAFAPAASRGDECDPNAYKVQPAKSAPSLTALLPAWEPGRIVHYQIDHTGQEWAAEFGQRANSRSLESAVVLSYESGQLIQRLYDEQGSIVFEGPFGPIASGSDGFVHALTLEDGTRETSLFDAGGGLRMRFGPDQHQYFLLNRPQEFAVYDPRGMTLVFKNSLFENGIGGRAGRPPANRSINVALDLPEFEAVANSPLVRDFEVRLYEEVRSAMGLPPSAKLDFAERLVRYHFYVALTKLRPPRVAGVLPLQERTLVRILSSDLVTTKELSALTHVILARQGLPSRIATCAGPQGVEIAVVVEGLVLDFGARPGVHLQGDYVTTAPDPFRLKSQLDKAESFIEVRGTVVGAAGPL